MAEVAGVALGVGSLIIAAVQSYKETKDLLSGFRHAPKKLRNAQSQMLLAEFAFRKANERLLCHCTNKADAKKMLSDSKSSLWQRTETLSRYEALLGDDQQSFEQITRTVLDRLDVLRKEIRSFSIVPEDGARAVKKRLRFAFEQSRVGRELQELMNINHNFVALVSLILPVPEQVERAASLSARSTTSSSPHVLSDLQRFKVVEKSAQDLYRALGTACNDHNIHRAILSLSPDCSDDHRTRFTLKFSQNSIQDEHSGFENLSMWLDVQSAFTGVVEHVEAEPEATSVVLARTKHPCTESSEDGKSELSHKPLRRKQRVRFQLPEPCKPTRGQLPVPAQPSAQLFLNLCKQGKICYHLARFHGLILPADEAIGYLDLSCGSKHVVYLKSRPSAVNTAPAMSRMRSLQQVLRQSRSGNLDDEIPLQQSLNLAHKLATAVLHFHATSWLPNAWDSQRILVAGTPVSGGPDIKYVMEPYAMTEIDKSSPCTQPLSAKPSQMLIRNRLLFSLGIVLLELAYQRPLASLTSDLDRIGVSSENVPYRTAERLSFRVGEKLGANYAELVRKCIHCDFGNGFDLKQMRLQEAFYQSVVCELAGLAKSPNWICAATS
jgi:hypothetical protein